MTNQKNYWETAIFERQVQHQPSNLVLSRNFHTTHLFFGLKCICGFLQRRRGGSLGFYGLDGVSQNISRAARLIVAGRIVCAFRFALHCGLIFFSCAVGVFIQRQKRRFSTVGVSSLLLGGDVHHCDGFVVAQEDLVSASIVWSVVFCDPFLVRKFGSRLIRNGDVRRCRNIGFCGHFGDKRRDTISNRSSFGGLWGKERIHGVRSFHRHHEGQEGNVRNLHGDNECCLQYKQ